MTEPTRIMTRAFPDWIGSFMEYTDGVPAPKIYRLWAGISAIAGALERRTWIQTTASGRLFPNMFLLLVGPPGVGKDQVIIPMRDLWAATGKVNIAPISMTHKGLIDQLADPGSQKTFLAEGPGGQKEWVNYHTLLVAVPEFGVLVPEHHLGFLSILNELFSCGDLFEERIRQHGEKLRIENPHLHMIAGTQPKYLGALLPESAYGMGFTARLIMIYAGDAVKVPIFTGRKRRADLRKKLTDDLRIVTSLYGEFNFSQETKDQIEDWHIVGSEKDKPTHSKLIYYSTRRIMHILKLCMILSASRRNDLEIGTEEFIQARDILLEAEEVMPEIFKEISSGGNASELEEAFHFLMRQFISKGKKPVPEAQLIQFLSSKVPANMITYMVDTLLRSGMIRERENTGGLNLPAKFRERLFEPVGLNPIE